MAGAGYLPGVAFVLHLIFHCRCACCRSPLALADPAQRTTLRRMSSDRPAQLRSAVHTVDP
jgi:hypothetical protein